MLLSWPSSYENSAPIQEAELLTHQAPVALTVSCLVCCHRSGKSLRDVVQSVASILRRACLMASASSEYQTGLGNLPQPA